MRAVPIQRLALAAVAILTMAVCPLAPAASGATPQYSFTKIEGGDYQGQFRFQAICYGVGSGGSVTGLRVNESDIYQPFLWKNGALTLLSDGGTGYAVNGSDVIVGEIPDRKSTRLNSSHGYISY